jgi:nucleoside 2-deoxyribosyltransferase
MGLRCFVAMAVNRNDTDQIYVKHILPTLRSMDITAVFMGRLEHNDDIDKRIISEIEKCDFAIADLTYVRPSVYFEAGYAERKVQVIYTCRTDHLGQGSGELRVHFDLLMRNIVSWSSPKDQRFAIKLAKRIKHVIRPLIQQRQTDAQAKAEADQFRTRPLVERIRFVADAFKSVLTSSGYRSIAKDDDRYHNPWFGRFRRGEVLEICGVCSADQFSKFDIRVSVRNMLEVVESRFRPSEYDSYSGMKLSGLKAPRPSETKNVKKMVARLMLCSLRRIPHERLDIALQYYRASGNGQVYHWLLGFEKKIHCDVFVHIIAPIGSPVDTASKGAELKRIIKGSS